MSGGKRAVLAGVLLCTGIALTAVALQQPEVPLAAMNGRQIYEHICQGCHMADGAGAVGAGRYPTLAKDPTLASRQYMALTLLMGRRNMPAFGEKHALGFGGPPVMLNDAQIAAVTNYVRTSFGNHYTDSITAAEVAALDQKSR
jgi:mono/diheme cytochrome c family protein